MVVLPLMSRFCLLKLVPAIEVNINKSSNRPVDLSMHDLEIGADQVDSRLGNIEGSQCLHDGFAWDSWLPVAELKNRRKERSKV